MVKPVPSVLTANTVPLLKLPPFLAVPYRVLPDKIHPHAGLILSGNTLYGTARNGGSFNNGTVFAVNTDGTGFTILHTFTAGYYNSSYLILNSDGASPEAGLILSGNTLYGTASLDGSSGYGTVFAVNTNGTGFTILHSFTAASSYPFFINSDG